MEDVVPYWAIIYLKREDGNQSHLPNGSGQWDMCNKSRGVDIGMSALSGFDLYRFIVDVYVVGFLCLFGFIGNALSIAVLYRDRDKKNTTNWLLQTLAVGDTLYLMACVFIQPLKTINMQTNWIPGLKNSFPYMERYISAAASIAQTITVWTVVLVTLDRFMAICKPLSTQLRSLERAKLTVIIAIVLAILYNIPRFFEREVVIEVNKQCNTTYVKVDKSAMRQSKIYFLVYKTICYFIFRAIGPLLTLIILNYKLIKALQEVRRRHEDLTRSGKHRENITLMLVVVVCVFIVCTLPDLFLRLIVAFREFFPHLTRGLQWHWLSAMNAIANMLLVVNSSINFLIYCLIGKKFRKILTQMYACGRRAGTSELSETEPLTTKTTTSRMTKLSEAEPLTTLTTNETNADNANGNVKDGDVSL
ncbi:hypothetical protein CAPTEDRAFT_182197 [Capitella teleta]|uniref:G-protein coupled receptors family 1 profile domain-containing protein n=1 Tax=Capitella teleta TaxID=283909 RepID=R7TT85_CAPTE|nr:hypothetical protein CAPTEDRAFT_182197 [Capitella teleta]|eukprot:ELT97118.1 hypothetical protein CAPTEDRAFT_182197 [Capitella teleta]